MKTQTSASDPENDTLFEAEILAKDQTHPPPNSCFIDEAEVLRRLPISRRTLFNWRTRGKIPYVAIGRRILFHWPSVSEALLRVQRGGE